MFPEHPSHESKTRRIRYSYEGSPTLAAFARCDASMRGLMGPFGSGKSSACAIELIRRGLAQRPVDPRRPPASDNLSRSRFAVVRNTYPELESTTQKTVFDWFPEHYFGVHSKSKHTYVIDAFEGHEIELVFLSLDRPEHVGKMLSLELTGAWVNEAREVPWELIRVLARRCNRYPSMRDGGATWWGVWCDTNPPDMQSDWYGYFETKKPANAAIFKQPSGLSPQAENKRHLPSTYYADMLDDLSEEEIKVYVHGEYGFLTDGKPVYPEFSERLHVSERAVARRNAGPIKRGWDFGLTPACIFTQMQANGQKRVVAELVAERAGVDAFSDAVLMFTRQRFEGYAVEDVGDPSGSYESDTREESCFDILVAKGINIEAGNQNPDARIESVRWGLKNLIDGAPALLVHPSCARLIQGFKGGYKHRRIMTGGGARYETKPQKNEYSHPHDALQYDCEQDFGPLLAGVVNPLQRVQTHASSEYDMFAEMRGRRAEPYADMQAESGTLDWDPLSTLRGT